MAMREPIRQLVGLGPLPDSSSASEDLLRLEMYQELLEAIESPVTDEEASALLEIFGPDECFGLAWAVVHLVESAPGWPVEGAFLQVENTWIQLLRERAARGGESGSR